MTASERIQRRLLPRSEERQLPRALVIIYGLFLLVLAPVYTDHYGLANFLWFSNIALFLTFVGVWLESPLLVSMQALSVTLLESIWTIDYLTALVFGTAPVELTAYMFDEEIPLLVRGLSLYHMVLPPLLIWLVYRLGYDSRALPAQTLLAWVVLPVCFFFTDPQENINWVFGWGEEPQELIDTWLYFGAVILAFPLFVYLPSHAVFRYFFSD